MPKPWENAEGYHDPTAYHGTKNIIRDEDEQQKRVNTLIFVLKYITRLAGFELLNRIEIKDRKTGREYKCLCGLEVQRNSFFDRFLAPDGRHQWHRGRFRLSDLS